MAAAGAASGGRVVHAERQCGLDHGHPGRQCQRGAERGLDTYAGTVSFATTVTLDGASTNALTASAAPVTLASNGTGSTTLMITASASARKQAPALPWKNGGAKNGGAMVLAVLLSAPFTLRRRRLLAVLLTALAISAAGFLIACSGGNSSSTPAPQPSSRTYYITVTGMGNPLNVTNPKPVTIAVTVP